MNEHEDLRLKLVGGVALLRDQRCWGVIAGSGTGSIIALHFGRQIPCLHPSGNRFLSPALQTHEGEFSLLIECAWRLDTPREVLCGSNDPDSNDGSMVMGLANIEGKRINSVAIVEPAFDLELAFENQCRLRIFCDQTSETHDWPNYSLRVGDSYFVVGARSRLSRSRLDA